MAAKEGDKVSVHYTGQLEDGSVFDSSRERDPMTFQLGAGRVVPGFERAVLGLEIGESVTRTIPCQEAGADADLSSRPATLLCGGCPGPSRRGRGRRLRRHGTRR